MEELYCDALALALDFERENQDFYREKLKETREPLARKALEFLIKEDDKHIEKILRFNRSLLENEEFDQEKECQIDVPEKVKELFKTLINKTTGKITAFDSDLEIYEKAMELENKGYKMYQLCSQNEELDEKIKRFFAYLAREESLHYDLLAKTKKYLEDPSYYFEEEGGWIFG